jgi:hypothetical protein
VGFIAIRVALELLAADPKSSMSHHFRMLRDAGVVHTRTHGPAHINELRRADLDRLFPGLLAALLASPQRI